MSDGRWLRAEVVEGGVGLITLAHPEQMNSWCDGLADEFFQAMNQFDADELGVRVVVITGEGKQFCTGTNAKRRFVGDDKESTRPEDPTLEEESIWRLHEIEKTSWRIKRFHDISRMRMPVIACINGGCVGVGLSLALACDMRFAAKDAKIGVVSPQRGLIAEDGAGYFLPNLVGTGNALLMLLTGDVLTAEDLPSGLIQRIFTRDALLPETLAFARKLAANSSPTAVSVIKQQAYLLPHLSLEEAQSINDRIQASCLTDTNPDHQEGFAAFTGKRPPRFNLYDQGLPYAKLARELLHVDLKSRL